MEPKYELFPEHIAAILPLIVAQAIPTALNTPRFLLPSFLNPI